jgi:hypothetical protein
MDINDIDANNVEDCRRELDPEGCGTLWNFHHFRLKNGFEQPDNMGGNRMRPVGVVLKRGAIEKGGCGEFLREK